MAHLFLVDCSLRQHVTVPVKPPQLRSGLAVERSWGRLRSSLPQRSGAARPDRSCPALALTYWRIRRSAVIPFKPRATACLNANGFKRAFSWRNRCLVCTVTSGLANTRAKGVWAGP